MRPSPLWNARNELWMQRSQSNRMAVSLWGSPGKSVCSTTTRSSCSSQHQWQSIQSWLNPLVCQWFWHVTLAVEFDEKSCFLFLRIWRKKNIKLNSSVRNIVRSQNINLKLTSSAHFKILSELVTIRGYSQSDWRDLWNTPLRWAQVLRYSYQVL
jgi:hypothetical protein